MIEGEGFGKEEGEVMVVGGVKGRQREELERRNADLI